MNNVLARLTPFSPSRLGRAALLTLTLLAAGWPVDARPESATLQQNFRNVDIVKLIEAVAKLTGKNFVIDPRVKGKVTLIAPSPMSPDALYETLLAILRVHGYAAIPGPNVIKIVPAVTARDKMAATFPPHNLESWVTEVIPLHWTPAAKLVGILRPLVAKEGLVVALSDSNQLVVMDTRANLERIKRIVRELDVQETPFEVIPLRHAQGDEILQALRPLLPPKVKLSVDDRSNRLILTGPDAPRRQIRALIASLDVPIPAEGRIEVVYLRYARAKNVADILKKLSASRALLNSALSAEGRASPSGKKPSPSTAVRRLLDASKPADLSKQISIEADESMNALLISAPPSVTKVLKSVIKQLDIRRAQVLIEAVLVELTQSKQAELGIEWGANGANGIGILNFSGTLPALLGNAGDPAAQAQALGRGLYVGGGDVDQVANRGWLALLRALKSDTNANILSTPTLLTLDNEEAEIVVGREVPFQTGSYANGTGNNAVTPFTTIERKNVGLKLKVKPQVNAGDEISLNLSVELSDVLPRGEAVDIQLSKREVKTRVVAGDGDIIVLGGLLTQRETEVESKIPGLGDIPVLGGLFRTTTNQREKVNLLVFLRPVIIRDGIASSFYSQRKYREIFQQQQRLKQRWNGSLLKGLRPQMKSLQQWQNDTPTAAMTATPVQNAAPSSRPDATPAQPATEDPLGELGEDL